MSRPRFDPKRLQETVEMPIDAVVRELVDTLGSHRIVALLAGVKSTENVTAWSRRDQAPESARQRALRIALQASRLIADLVGRQSAAAWFVGTNASLNFDSPARVLRDRGEEGCLLVMRAAHDFVSEEMANADIVGGQNEHGDMRATRREILRELREQSVELGAYDDRES
jgi:hypothetical protein